MYSIKVCFYYLLTLTRAHSPFSSEFVSHHLQETLLFKQNLLLGEHFVLDIVPVIFWRFHGLGQHSLALVLIQLKWLVKLDALLGIKLFICIFNCYLNIFQSEFCPWFLLLNRLHLIDSLCCNQFVYIICNQLLLLESTFVTCLLLLLSIEFFLIGAVWLMQLIDLCISLIKFLTSIAKLLFQRRNQLIFRGQLMF